MRGSQAKCCPPHPNVRDGDNGEKRNSKGPLDLGSSCLICGSVAEVNRTCVAVRVQTNLLNVSCCGQRGLCLRVDCGIDWAWDEIGEK
jgi:hypothetical protein